VTLRFVPQAELARLRAPECLVRGRGIVLREGADGPIVTTGPGMDSQAWSAAELGQGDAVLAAGVPATKLALEDMPRCGANEEVLRAHGLDADGIAERVAASVGVPA